MLDGTALPPVSASAFPLSFLIPLLLLQPHAGSPYGSHAMSNNYNYSTQDLQAAPQGYGTSLPPGARPPRAYTGQQTYAPIPLPEANAPRNSVWLEKQQARSRRSKFIVRRCRLPLRSSALIAFIPRAPYIGYR